MQQVNRVRAFATIAIGPLFSRDQGPYPMGTIGPRDLARLGPKQQGLSPVPDRSVVKQHRFMTRIELAVSAKPTGEPPWPAGDAAAATIPAAFLRQARARGDAVYLHFFKGGAWRSVSWAETAECAVRVACGLVEQGLKPGDHVVIIGNPGRYPDDHRLRMVNITRPSDGWKWGGSFD